MGTDSPFITIGIASYNYARFLPEAFDRLRQQKFRDYEVLYCDDGSTDNSVEVIRGFMQDNPDMNIRLIQAENGGILANKNRILENARGQYLMICDADDYMSPNCLELLCGAAQRENADCVIGAFQEVDNDHRVLKSHLLPKNPSKWLYSQHHAQIYKTELVRGNGIRFTDIPDDVPYLQTMHTYCQKTAYVYEPVYFWRQHNDSVSKDIAVHKEWSPVPIWTKLVKQMLQVKTLLKKHEDLTAIDYYLYKYYYINTFACQSKDVQKVSAQLKEIQKQMKQAMANYQKISCFFTACKTGDTVFAKTMVIGCWLLERLGLLHFLIKVRTFINAK